MIHSPLVSSMSMGAKNMPIKSPRGTSSSNNYGGGLPSAGYVSNAPVEKSANLLSDLVNNYGQGPMARATQKAEQFASDRILGGMTPQASSLQQALMGGLGGTGGLERGLATAVKSAGGLEKGKLSALQSLLGAGQQVGKGDLANINRMIGLRDADFDSKVKAQSSRELDEASRPSGGLLGFLGL